MSTKSFSTHFAPMLLVRDSAQAIGFYQKAFGAIEERRWNNEDGSVHVAQLSIDGAVFHLRGVDTGRGHLDALQLGGITTIIELWVEDPQSLMERALAAGGRTVSPVRDYTETGYQEGTLEDPFGHRWQIMRPL